jgi:hypothetical protein
MLLHRQIMLHWLPACPSPQEFLSFLQRASVAGGERLTLLSCCCCCYAAAAAAAACCLLQLAIASPCHFIANNRIHVLIV